VPAVEAGRGDAIPPIFGRSDVLAEIERTLERVAGRRGETLIISGEEGAGKSLFASATVHRARARGLRVLAGRALPQEIPQPFSLLRELLRPYGAGVPSNGGRVETDPVLPLFLAPYGPESAAGAGGSEPVEAPAEASTSLEAVLAPLDSPGDWIGTSRSELYARVTQYLTDLGHEAPVVAVIDDLHLADPATLEFLGRLAPKLADQPIALVATVALGSRIPPAARALVDSIAHASTARTVPLGRLAVGEVGEFAKWLRRGLAADPADVLRWQAQTEGNPLFVEQLVRASSAYGVRAPALAAGEAADLNDILLARAQGLGEVERRTLTYASLLGREFALGTLQAISEMSEERLSEIVDRLVREGQLRERDGEVLEFTTEGLRAAIYSGLTQTRRRLLHRRVARTLEARRLAGEFELARHYYLGRDDAKAEEYNERAARTAMRTFAFENAVPHLDRAIEAERRRPDRELRREILLLTELGRALDELGDLKRSETVLSEAVALARREIGLDAELGRVLLALAQTRQDQAEFASAEALAQEAYGRLERHGTPREVMTAHRVLGIAYWRLGQVADAEQHLRLALDISEREGSPVERGHALIDVANAMILGGEPRFEAALALYEQAAELFASGQDEAARARVLMNRSVLLYSTGRTREAIEGIHAAIEAAERSKSPIWIGYCYLNLGQMLAETGDLDHARPAIERATATLEPLGDRLAPEQLSLTRGLLAQAEGKYDRAQEHLEDALRQAQELGVEPDVGEMHFRLAALAHARGDDATARVKLAEARASGIDRHRTDLASRVAELDRALAG
jgi:tetratricopeptide (TPR) repeat protein